jgi:arginine-tRNA-protein transferase
MIKDLTPGVYRALLDRNFRRSGKIVYRPVCESCAECRQMRIPVHTFQPTRSQRRVWRSGADLKVAVKQSPKPTRTKWRLFRDYVREKHDNVMRAGFADFAEFLYDAPIPFLEITYKLGRKIIGVSVADLCGDALSSIYMYFDPAQSRRSLGTFSALWEIELCRKMNLDYYYLGYYIQDAVTMNYKSRFKPNETLTEQFEWRPEDTTPCPS